MAAYVGADTLGIALVMQHVFRSSLRMDLALTCGCFMETQNITITFLPVLFHVRTWMSFFFLPLSLLIWAHGIMLFSLLSFGGLWIVVWTFVCWILSFACGQALFHKPQLRIDRIYPGTLHTPPHIPWISLHHSHQSLAPLFYFLSLNFLPLSYVFLLFFPPEYLVPAWTQLEHISTCISSDYRPYIHTHTLAELWRSAPAPFPPLTDRKHLWCNVILLRHTCDQSHDVTAWDPSAHQATRGWLC